MSIFKKIVAWFKGLFSHQKKPDIRNDPRQGRPFPPVAPIPLDPAPEEPAPGRGRAPACISSTDEDNFVQFKELLDMPGDRGEYLRKIWWCAQTPLVSDMIDHEDGLARWALAGNIGCTVDGIIEYGKGAPGRGFDSPTGLLHISKMPPKRYERRIPYGMDKSNPENLRIKTVIRRQLDGYPVKPASECLYNQESTGKLVYRCRIYDVLRNEYGRAIAYVPVPADQHGAWLRKHIEAIKWDPRLVIPGTGTGDDHFSPIS